MRVLHIIPTLDRAGAEKQLVLLARGLKRLDLDVHVCALTRLGPLEQPLASSGIPLHCIHKRWKYDPAALARLTTYIKRLKPHIVHTWIFAANCYGRQAAFRAQVPHVIAGERCVDRWKSWHHLAIDRYLARRTDWIATNSSGVVDFYVQHGISADKFQVIPNAVEPPSPVASSRDALLEELQLPPGARLIGAVGRLWPQKNYKDLIWAADLLKVIREDVHVLIVGDGPERERLEQYRRLVQIGDRVHLLGHRHDVPRLLAHLDCFWLASSYEGQSNALMEALARGIACVVTDIAGNRDLIQHDVHGYLVPVGDRAGFARWTNLLLTDASLAERIGSAARSRMLSEFTVDGMVQNYVALYRRTIEG